MIYDVKNPSELYYSDVSDKEAEAHLTAAPPSGEVIVPSVHDGKTVTVFNYSTKFDAGTVKSVKLPASVHTFKFSPQLTYGVKIEIDENNPYLFSDGKAVYTKDRSELICFAARDDEEYTIRAECRTIGRNAFYGAFKLKRVVFPSDIRNIGEYAFRECTSIEKISLKCDRMGKGAFEKCSGLIEAEVDIERTPDDLFEFCQKLRKVVLKNTRVIGEKTFYSTSGLEEIVFPPELEAIETLAFGYSRIKPLIIPQTVKNIEKDSLRKVREIHIYDNTKIDMNPENDISWFNYDLFVRSAETDEIKYAVSVFGGEDRRYYDDKTHGIIIGMFRDGVDFDFREFNSFFLNTSDDLKYDDLYPMEMLNAGILRMKYGYELDEKTRREYEKKCGKLIACIVEEYLEDYELDMLLRDELFDPELYKYVSAEQLLPLIDRAARDHLTELTAFLMRICHDKRTGERSVCDEKN